MADGPDHSGEVAQIARDLCLSEGWDPEELIGCEPGEVPGAHFDAQSGAWLCRRWHAYAPAAERRLQKAVDDWDEF